MSEKFSIYSNPKQDFFSINVPLIFYHVTTHSKAQKFVLWNCSMILLNLRRDTRILAFNFFKQTGKIVNPKLTHLTSYNFDKTNVSSSNSKNCIPPSACSFKLSLPFVLIKAMQQITATCFFQLSYIRTVLLLCTVYKETPNCTRLIDSLFAKLY